MRLYTRTISDSRTRIFLSIQNPAEELYLETIRHGDVRDVFTNVNCIMQCGFMELGYRLGPTCKDTCKALSFQALIAIDDSQ